MTHDYAEGNEQDRITEDVVLGWARELGLAVSSPTAEVGARWVSIETRQVLASADLEMVVEAGKAVEVLDRVVRAAAGTLTLMRQLGGAPSREPAVAWCETHEQYVTRCRSDGSLCNGVMRSGPADPTGTAATGPDPVERDRREMARMLAHLVVMARALDVIDRRYTGTAMVDEAQHAGPGPDNCRCCWSADQLVAPVSVNSKGQVRYKGLCRRCGQWRSVLGGVDPPSWMVRKAIYKETISGADWDRAREQTAPLRKKAKKRKGRK